MNLKTLFGASMLATASLFAQVHAADADHVKVINPYARAVPPTAAASAAFMVLKNTSDHDTALVGADSDVARVTELHTHIHKNGMMMMRPVEKIDLPAHKATPLQPGGYHIMLINLKHPLKPGDTVHLTLTFKDGSTKQVTAPVKMIHAGMGMKMYHH
ncbi:hypothetical protein SAMN05443662_0698 [Sulfurivirga caldicuralii]|uniref:Copper(I)-binding protein n=1 Tax=Sulfurivirga caldicuralii TaxID=364032 RepID=A0A1N6ENM5_9GAMM|nr:copper chaperone PCu(A)C [Sulfurivirga caldicuralii]SIN84682.1 hypothetical protein SAMN05443662_0698 [Sulfurivirga caldicuralii]